jgi:excisionase family DNA binding protein
VAFALLKTPADFHMINALEGLRLVTLSEAAHLLQLSTRPLQRMIRRNELPAFKLAGQRRVRESQLTRWIAVREEPAGGTPTADEVKL